MNILKIIGIIILVILALISLFFGFIYYVVYYAPMVPKDYTTKVKTGGKLEEKYLHIGKYEVETKFEKTIKPIEKYVVYYPKELEKENKKYPVVVVVNGTGVFANKEKALLKHLASWDL